MWFIEKSFIYQNLTKNIKKNTKNLIIDFNYNIEDIRKIDNNMNIELHFYNVKCRHINNTFKNIFLFEKDIFEIIEEPENIVSKFDNIFFINLLTSFDIEKIKVIFNNCGKILKSEDSNLIFIDNLITKYNQYSWHPFSYIRNFILDYCVYISNIYDYLNYSDIIVINSDRILTVDIPTYPVEIFCITCRKKF